MNWLHERSGYYYAYSHEQAKIYFVVRQGVPWGPPGRTVWLVGTAEPNYFHPGGNVVFNWSPADAFRTASQAREYAEVLSSWCADEDDDLDSGDEEEEEDDLDSGDEEDDDLDSLGEEDDDLDSGDEEDDDLDSGDEEEEDDLPAP